jgi:hypothetical protein
MALVPVTLDRVFDLHRRSASRYAPQRTDFSFECAGKKHYAVEAPGWPRISEGDTWTAVLTEDGNWQTLVGWKNHTTDDAVVPDIKRTISGVVQGAFLIPYGCFLAIDAATTLGCASAICFTVFLALFELSLVLQWRRKKSQARAIRSLTQNEHFGG